MGSFAQRLRDAMQSAGLKAVDLHERTGISKASISEYLSGNYEPKQKNVYRLAEALHVAPSYLMGLSETASSALPAPPSAQEAAEPYKAPLTKRDELTEHEREHIELYRELDERGRNAVDDLTDLHVERVRESTERSSGSTGTENAAEKRA